MRDLEKTLRGSAVAAALALAAGCASVQGPGVVVTSGPRLEIRNASCALTAMAAPQTGTAALSSSARFFGITNRIAVLSARLSAASGDPAMRQAGWKRLATGDC